MSVAQRLETFFDFVVEREPPALRLREDQPAVHEHVELTGFAGFDFGVLAEAIFE